MHAPQRLNSLTAQFYDRDPMLEDNRLRQHRIEHEVTLRTILNRLPSGRTGLKILDVGGGTGPYSFALAARGHDVTLVDLSSGLLSLARTRAESLGPELRPSRILEGDATALSDVIPASECGTFDIVLLLGPLYHIMSAELREQALLDAWTMVRHPEQDGGEGGTLFCAWVSRWAHYRDVATRDPGRLAKKKDFYAQHAQDGGLLSWDRRKFRDYIRYDASGKPCHAMNHEMPANMPLVLRRVTGEAEVIMVGTEGILAGDLDHLVNNLQGKEFEAWVDKCLDVGTDECGWMLSHTGAYTFFGPSEMVSEKD
ncbi:S-adenosyl-L-methionine-dependent methyltransferase [Trametes meyenii]|nr:S-adenosyl-L-methionine-dependent methyltransferase [Trametes meyenii]